MNDSTNVAGAPTSHRPPLLSRGSADFGDGLSAAFELIATPGLFGVAGFFLDRWLGTVPIFTLLFTVLVFGYMVWKFWYLYTEDVNAAAEARRDQNAERAKAEAGLTRRERTRQAS